MNVIFGRKLNQLKECSVRAVDTGELVLKHQAISGHSAEYAPISFPFFMLFTKFQIKYNANWWCITWPWYMNISHMIIYTLYQILPVGG